MQGTIPNSMSQVEMIPRKLNLGCGNNKIDGYINIDTNDDVEPDMAYDITQKGLAFFPAESVSEILMFHMIEHIEEKYHEFLLQECHRVLVPNGNILISYPEFIKCAENYITNYRGQKAFWKATIYGLQRSKGDFHVSLMESEVFVELLDSCGFVGIAYQAEKHEPWNTIVIANKGESPKTYEDLLAENMLDWQKE